jgi:hypothetical protein
MTLVCAERFIGFTFSCRPGVVQATTISASSEERWKSSDQTAAVGISLVRMTARAYG